MMKKTPKPNDYGASAIADVLIKCNDLLEDSKKTITELSDRVKYLEGHMLFCVEKNEIKKVRDFMKKHSHCERGAIGGATTVSFSPTSIGIVVKVKCHCGKEKDVTDYSVW